MYRGIALAPSRSFLTSNLEMTASVTTAILSRVIFRRAGAPPWAVCGSRATGIPP